MTYKRIVTSFFLLILLGVVLTGCDGSSGSKQGSTPVQSPVASTGEEAVNYDTEVFGVVKAIDSVQGSITIYDIENELDMVFTYTGGTDVRDSYDKMITISQIELGEIVNGYYYYSNRKLAKLEVNKDAWTYNGVETLSMDQSENIITIAKKLYRYDERIVITDGDSLIEPIDLNSQDELTVKGIDKYIYSIRVTKGHGYIRLENYDPFVGGIIEVGYGIIVPIAEDMLLVAREGSYRVVLENGELQAVKNINLLRDEEITLDLSDYKAPEERVGYVNFDISPIGADLYVNGTLVNYAEPVKLNYGEHVIRVSLTGYQDFTGILNIGESTSTVHISLADGASDESSTSDVDSSGDSSEGNSGSSNSSSDNSSGTSSGSAENSDNSADTSDSNTTLEESEPSEGTASMGTIEIDEDHTITIQGPEGAKVYLNGTLRGTAPVTIPKEIGTHTITLSKKGYTTKSYTVEVENNGEDVTFNFPDMTAVAG